MNVIIDKIINSADLLVDEKVRAVTTSLYALPDHGVAVAMEFIFRTDASNKATYPSNYLALLPNIVHEKRQVVEYILEHRNDLLVAAVSLIRDMPQATVESLVQAYLCDPTLDGMDSVIYELALFFPECLQKYAERICDEDIGKTIFAGGPDEWVVKLAKKYATTRSPEQLRDLGRFHTDRAVSVMLDLWPKVPDENRTELYTYIESSGVFPDTRKASVYDTTYRGHVVARAGSPHAMGGVFVGSVPACAICGTTANRILTLKTDQLCFTVGGEHEPSFFWIACGHTQDYVVARMKPTGAEGIMTPTLDAPASVDIVPGELALALELHPNQFGYGIEVVPGFGLHQVGGYPPWCKLNRFPRCPICSEGMRFLVAIDSGMTPFGRLDFDGMFYGFWCETCNVSATMMQ